MYIYNGYQTIGHFNTEVVEFDALGSPYAIYGGRIIGSNLYGFTVEGRSEWCEREPAQAEYVGSGPDPHRAMERAIAFLKIHGVRSLDFHP